VNKKNEPVLELAIMLKPIIDENEEYIREFNSSMSELLPELLDARIKYGNKTFVPDANSTLRFTYGYISGYKAGMNPHPEPFTHKSEVLKKNEIDNVDYRLTKQVKNMLMVSDFNQNLTDETGDVVVCMLYNMDTTGGNSGSPVMNKKGELVGVNFDRAYTATLKI